MNYEVYLGTLEFWFLIVFLIRMPTKFIRVDSLRSDASAQNQEKQYVKLSAQ